MNKVQKRIIQMFVVCMAFLFLNGITVKADSADNSLQSLTLSEGTLSPAFQYNIVSYTASVGNGTTSVDINAKVSDATATIQSITGNTDLKEGSNTIKIIVEAENGNLATYTINLTRAASGTAGTGTDQNESDATNPDTNQTSPGGDNQEPDTDGDDITINTGSYTISATIPEEVIPGDFTMTEVTYQDETCEALQFDKGSIILLYMTDEEGGGALFVWNQTDGSVYPFIRLTAGEKYIIIQPMPAENVPGEEFHAADLSIEGKAVPSVYQNDMEGMEDFYLIYAVDNDGVGGVYWYDKIGGTYQRYVEMSQEESTGGVEYEFLQKEFTELSNKYTNIKSKDTKIITGLIIALAICVILIINLFISRGKYSRFEDEIELEDENITEKSKPAKKTKKEEEPEFFDENIWRPKKEKPKKKKKREDIFDNDDFMDDDTFFDDDKFEETPGGKKPSIQDDLEILDLNDL